MPPKPRLNKQGQGLLLWDKAEELWGKLKPKAEENPNLKNAIEKVARKPEDTRVIGNLEVELEDVFFNEDVELGQTINSIVITGAVGMFPLGMNDYGLLDMSGNVLEWCATEWQENYNDYLKKENNKPDGKSVRVARTAV